MKHGLAAVTLGAGLSLTACIAPAAADTAPLGVWIDHNGRGAVEIKPCGSALCGYVVAVKSTNDAKGCGKQIIGGAKADGPVWSGGWIYSPEKRKTYDLELKPLNDGTLRVVGFAGIRMFSRTMIWKPAPPDLKRCDQGEQIAAAHTAVASPIDPAPVAETVRTPPKPQQPSTAADTAKSPVAPEAITTTPKPDEKAPIAKRPDGQSASADADTAIDNGPPTAREKNPALGGLDLDRVFSQANGKCKIDLPWIKLSVDCKTD